MPAIPAVIAVGGAIIGAKMNQKTASDAQKSQERQTQMSIDAQKEATKIDPRIEAMLYGNGQATQTLKQGAIPHPEKIDGVTRMVYSPEDYETKTDSGLLGRIMGNLDKPQSSGMTAAGTAADRYLGANAGSDLTAMREGANRLLAGNTQAPQMSAANAAFSSTPNVATAGRPDQIQQMMASPSTASFTGANTALGDAARTSAGQSQAFLSDAAKTSAENAGFRGMDAAQMQAASFNPALMGSAAQMQSARLNDPTRANVGLLGSPTAFNASRISAPSQNKTQLDAAFNEMIYGNSAENEYLNKAISSSAKEAGSGFNEMQDSATRNLMENIMPTIRGGAIASGQYGGSRQGILESRAVSDFSKQMSDAAKGLAQNQNTASLQARANAIESGRGRALSALSNLNQNQYGTAFQDASILNNAGQFNVGNQNQFALQDAANRNAFEQFNVGNQNQFAQQNAGYQQQVNAANQAAQNAQMQFNTGIQNQSGQFNAANQQQANAANQAASQSANQYNSGAYNQNQQFNAANQNAANQYNAGAQNAVNLANAAAQTGASQFNTAAANQANNANAGFQQQTNLANQNALNANNQFNAGAQNQLGQFNAGLLTDTSRFNASQGNALNQYTSGLLNQNNQFNANALNQNNQFNTAAANQNAQYNAGLGQQANQSNMQSQLATNAANAQNTLGGIGALSNLSANAYNTANNLNNADMTRYGQISGLLQPYSGKGSPISVPQYQPITSNPWGSAIGGATAAMGLYNAFNQPSQTSQSNTGSIMNWGVKGY